MFNKIWPRRLETPHFELGSSFEEGVKVLRELGEIKEEVDKYLGRFVRVDTKRFCVAIYEKDGRIHAVWYDDPLGRSSNKGIGRKIGLYLERFGMGGEWRQTHDNGYSVWWLNEKDERLLDYGLHCDVILITDRRNHDGE